MKSVEESVIMSMDGSATELFEFLPYLFQDVWGLGSDPDLIVRLIAEHFYDYHGLEVLDLGCGKGAVTVQIAHTLQCKCLGIDAVPDFIRAAAAKAGEYKAEHLCTFLAGDIRSIIHELQQFDVIILGAIGPVFGNYYTTLSMLSGHLRDSGIIIIDDGYIADASDYSHVLMQKRQDMIEQIHKAAMRLLRDEIIPPDTVRAAGTYFLERIKQRCYELIKQYPDQRGLFENYLKNQMDENDALENKAVCTTMVIGKEGVYR